MVCYNSARLVFVCLFALAVQCLKDVVSYGIRVYYFRYLFSYYN